MLKKKLWIEKYRPSTIKDVIFQDEKQAKQFLNFVEEQNIPNLLLSGVQGTGKTSISKALINDLNIDLIDVLRINCSDEKIDAMRDKVYGFASAYPTSNFNVVQLEECLQKNTLVRVLRNGKELAIPISQIDSSTDLVKSWDNINKNIVWLPFIKKYMGKRKLIKIVLSNGEIIFCTKKHKWIGPNGDLITTSELFVGSKIFSPKINKL